MIKLLLALVLMSSYSFAENSYITGVQKVTFRTGPGTDNKIIKMVESDSKIILVESGETWSLVKDAQGTEGYILNRFLTKKVPFQLKYKWLKKKHDKLISKNESLNLTKNDLNTQAGTVQKELTEVKEQLASTKKLYDELKLGAANYISLKSKYDSMLSSLGAQTKKVKSLESKISVYYIKWFLAGGGVLFLGWIIGLMSRKKKSYSGLSL